MREACEMCGGEIFPPLDRVGVCPECARLTREMQDYGISVPIEERDDRCPMSDWIGTRRGSGTDAEEE